MRQKVKKSVSVLPEGEEKIISFISDFSLGSKRLAWNMRENVHKLSLSYKSIIQFVPTWSLLERIYKPHYDYQNFSPLANGTDLNRQKYAILQTHWH